MSQNPYTSSDASFDDLSEVPTSQHPVYDSTSVSTGSTASTASTGGQPMNGNGSTSASLREEAASVTSDAAESGKHVAGTAASEVKDVVGEARTQLSTLLDQFRSEASDQAAGQSDRAVKGLRSLSEELRQMASSSQQHGIATDLANQAAGRVQSVAGWLEQRQPAEVLDEVRSYARRRPGTFLAAAAVVGLIGGRLTRGLTAGSSSSSPTASTDTPAYAVPPAPSVGADTTTIDTGVEPAAYTSPRPVAGDLGRVEGFEGADLGQGLR